MRRAGLNEGVVIEAAVTMVDRLGAQALTLSHLAEALGVRTPSLYKHVAGLDGVRRGVALWGLRELGRRMGRAAVGKAGDEAVAAMADAYRQFAKDHPGVYPLTVQAPSPDDADLSAAGNEVVALVATVLTPYGLDGPATVHTIRGFRAIVHGFVSLEVLGGFGLPLDVDVSFRNLVDLFITGLRRA